MNELVFKGQNDRILTTSLKVAEVFSKEHQHVLRDIRNLIEGVSKIGDTPMFVETTYILLKVIAVLHITILVYVILIHDILSEH